MLGGLPGERQREESAVGQSLSWTAGSCDGTGAVCLRGKTRFVEAQQCLDPEGVRPSRQHARTGVPVLHQNHAHCLHPRCVRMGQARFGSRFEGGAKPRLGSPLVGATCGFGPTRAPRFFGRALHACDEGRGLDTCPMEGMDSKRVKRILELPRKAEVCMVVSAGKRTEKGGVRRTFPFHACVRFLQDYDCAKKCET